MPSMVPVRAVLPWPWGRLKQENKRLERLQLSKHWRGKAEVSQKAVSSEQRREAGSSPLLLAKCLALWEAHRDVPKV